MRTPLVALALLLALPSAAAHTTVSAADGTLCFTVGHTHEPVATYVRSGLDLTVREKLEPGGDCGSDNRGAEVADFHNAITTAVIHSPSGATMDLMPVDRQFGATGRYTGSQAYVLTEPGQYMLRLEGSWEGHDFSGDYDISRDIPDMEDLLFPRLDEGATVAALQDRIDDLEAEVAALGTELARLEALEAKVATLESEVAAHEETERDSPAGALVAVLAVVGLAVVLARRQS